MSDLKSTVYDLYTNATSSKLFYSYPFFIIAYTLLVLLPAPQQVVLKRYHVSVTGLRLIDLSIIVILAIIWFIGFYGYANLKTYAALIHKDKDGEQIALLTRGICLLALWLPISLTVSTLLNFIASKHVELMSAFTIVSNYISLLLPFAGFLLIGRSAHGLRKLIRKRASYSYNLLLFMIVLLTYISIIYIHLIVSSSLRNLIYHLSFWLISLTVVAPYVLMWAIGFLAVLEIYHYQQNVEGLIYRRSLRNLALGVAWLLLTSIIYQYLATLTKQLDNLSVYVILVIIYALLALFSVGFVFIALGAKKLQQIEEL